MGLPPTNSTGSYGRPQVDVYMPDLVDKLQQEFHLRCHVLPRTQWNPELGTRDQSGSLISGLQGIKRLCLEDSMKAAVLVAVADRPLALSASAALLHWVSTEADASFRDMSLRIQYKTIKGALEYLLSSAITPGHMFIDSESARNLELVRNNLTMKPTNTLYCECWDVLITATLNDCDTPMGMRLLRSSLLQPSNRESSCYSTLPQARLSSRTASILCRVRSCYHS